MEITPVFSKCFHLRLLLNRRETLSDWFGSVIKRGAEVSLRLSFVARVHECPELFLCGSSSLQRSQQRRPRPLFALQCSAAFPFARLHEQQEMIMRYVVLWALGVPISGLIVLHLLGMI